MSSIRAFIAITTFEPSGEISTFLTNLTALYNRSEDNEDYQRCSTCFTLVYVCTNLTITNKANITLAVESTNSWDIFQTEEKYKALPEFSQEAELEQLCDFSAHSSMSLQLAREPLYPDLQGKRNKRRQTMMHTIENTTTVIVTFLVDLFCSFSKVDSVKESWTISDRLFVRSWFDICQDKLRSTLYPRHSGRNKKLKTCVWEWVSVSKLAGYQVCS